MIIIMRNTATVQQLRRPAYQGHHGDIPRVPIESLLQSSLHWHPGVRFIERGENMRHGS